MRATWLTLGRRTLTSHVIRIRFGLLAIDIDTTASEYAPPPHPLLRALLLVFLVLLRLLHLIDIRSSWS